MRGSGSALALLPYTLFEVPVDDTLHFGKHSSTLTVSSSVMPAVVSASGSACTCPEPDADFCVTSVERTAEMSSQADVVSE